MLVAMMPRHDADAVSPPRHVSAALLRHGARRHVFFSLLKRYATMMLRAAISARVIFTPPAMPPLKIVMPLWFLMRC